MARILIETYGCTLNQADSEIMEGVLKQHGHEVSSGKLATDSDYDYVIVNTCTVKTPTEQRILDRLGMIAHFGRKLIVTGCMASANVDRILRRAPLSSIVTTANVHRIGDAVDEIENGVTARYTDYHKVDKVSYLSATNSTIAKIPISEGCLSSCNFCETKYARGPLNSFPQETILKAMQAAIGNGAREIELTSQDVGAYGFDRRTNIAELVSAATDIDGDFKIRIGMLNPEHLHKYLDQLVEAYGDSKVYKFIHMPVQSGSDMVLRSMKRNYTAETFIDLVLALREDVRDISIATDMIVGYPTEAESDFEESMRIIEETRPSRINISRFGARPHAGASKLKQLDNNAVKDRCIRMYRLSRQIEVEALTRIVGERRRILLTERRKGSVVGRDDSYREVAIRSEHFKLGESIEVDIYGSTAACLLAAPVEARMKTTANL